MKRVSQGLEQEAIEVFKSQTSKNVSFVDCTNMAVMNAFNIKDIFSFDGSYKTNGFNLVEMVKAP
jgi:predicted nucleic acid-binding protein